VHYILLKINSFNSSLLRGLAFPEKHFEPERPGTYGELHAFASSKSSSTAKSAQNINGSYLMIFAFSLIVVVCNASQLAILKTQ